MRIGNCRSVGRRVLQNGVAVLLATTSMVSLAVAQDGPDTGGQPTVLDEITLNAEGDAASGGMLMPQDSSSATKSDTPLLRTPQAVNVVPRAQFEAQSADLITEALRYTPGVMAESNGYDIRYDWLWIRGFDAYGYTWQDGLLIPGDPVNYATPAIDPFTLERVEVIKGPASALYGQNMPGGMINLVSKRPQSTTSREVFAKTSSLGGYQIGGDFTGPLSRDGSLSYRLIGAVKNMGSQIDQERNRRVTFAPSLTWEPGDSTRLTAFAYYQKDEDTFSPRFYPAHGTLLPNPAGEIPRDLYLGDPAADEFNREYASVGYELEHDLSANWTLRQNLRYARSTQDMFLVLVNPAFSWPGWPGTPGPVMNRVTAASDDELRSLAMDLSVEGRFATGSVEHTALIGVDYSWVWSSTNFGNSAMDVHVPGLDFTDPEYGGFSVDRPPFTRSALQNRRQLGIYVQDQLSWGPWIATAGLRYDRSEIDTFDRITDTRQPDNNHDAVTGRLGISYQFANGVSPYAAYSSSFIPQLGVGDDGKPFEASETEMYEIGLKYTPPGTSNLFTASLFQLTEDNTLIPNPLDGWATIQGGEQRVRGLELEAKFAMTPRLDVIAGYAYSDSEVLSSVYENAVGQEVLRLPRHQASLWVQYKDAGLPGLDISAGIRGVSDYQSSPQHIEELRIPGYGLVDLGVTYDLAESPWQVEGATMQLHASNIFDRRFVAQCLNLTGGSCNYGEGRTIEAKIGYKW